MMIESVNPATGKMIERFDPLSEEKVETKVARAAKAFEAYRLLPFSERARRMVRAAEILEEKKEAFGRVMTAEMGKPIKAAIAEAEKCAWACRYYAENAERFLADEEVKTDATRSYIHYQPLGPILAVMPWNFPFWQVFRFAAPALMAGNVALLKHASNVPRCALMIEEVFRQAGFPEGAFQTLLVGSGVVQRLIDDSRIMAITLTGSVGAGAAVGANAGRQIKKTVLELGGSDPFIVMPSADLDEAAAAAVKARTINNGQSCIAAKRFIVAAPVAGAFQERFVRGMKALKVGDPMDPTTDVGPLATADILSELDEQVKKSKAAGAKILLGGERLNGPGNYYSPTVLADIPKGAPAYSDELFGPVASIFRAANAAEAIRIANDTVFGLGASVWTNDRTEQALFIDGIASGMVFINGMVVSDPRLPFGGVKQSGYGRELGILGIREFVNIKTVWIRQGTGGTLSETE